jgi:hypothetical protein
MSTKEKEKGLHSRALEFFTKNTCVLASRRRFVNKMVNSERVM